MMFGFGRKNQEARAVTATQSQSQIVQVLGLDDFMRESGGVTVTPDAALSVPAIWAAVNFISGTIAGLPLHVYRRSNEERQQVRGPLAGILHDAWNDETTAFKGWKYTLEQILTTGRAFVFIERNGASQVVNLWPLIPENMTVKLIEGRREYHYIEPGGRRFVYEAREILDLAFMLRPDQVRHRSPILANKDVIGLAIAATRYGARFLQTGGVPPFAVTGNFQSGQAMKRAADDLQEAVKQAAKEDRQALILPAGLDIKQIGGDPEKSQLVETQRFMVEQIGRIYSLPPTFLQDLTHGTFSNTEQQDLHFVKHTLKRWIEDVETELNLKLFGRRADRFVKFNVDGLLRGDFKTRMEGYATAVQHGIRSPDEVRALENLPPMAGGDQLFIQGATVPITSAGEPTGGDQ